MKTGWATRLTTIILLTLVCAHPSPAEETLETIKREFYAAKYPKNRRALRKLGNNRKHCGKETVSFLTSLLTREYAAANEKEGVWEEASRLLAYNAKWGVELPETTVAALKVLIGTKPSVLEPDEDEDDRLIPAYDFPWQAKRALGEMRAFKVISKMRARAKSLYGPEKLDYLITIAFFDRKSIAFRAAKSDLMKEGDAALVELRWHLPKADKDAKRRILRYLEELKEIDEKQALELYLIMVSSCPPESRLGDLLKLPAEGEKAKSTRKTLVEELEAINHRWSSYPRLYAHIAKTFEKPEAARKYLVGVVCSDVSKHRRTGAARVLAQTAEGRKSLYELLRSENAKLCGAVVSALVAHFSAKGGIDKMSSEDRKQLEFYLEKFPKDGDSVPRVKHFLDAVKRKEP